MIVPRHRFYSPRKQRTREHVLEDLSINHVEKIALGCGYAVDRLWHDYGLDLVLFTFNDQGYLENGIIWMQLKATDRLKRSRNGMILIRLDRRDVLAWISERFPVILVMYDAVADLACWLSIQTYFAGAGAFARLRGETITVSIPTANALNEQALRDFARWKADLLNIRHGDHT
jgi:Domain of unknown function (DUF4365)